MFLYKLFEEALYSEETGEYSSFGLCVYRVSGESEEKLLSVSDVSLDREFVEKLAKSFNDFQLSPVHIYEAIENAIGV